MSLADVVDDTLARLIAAGVDARDAMPIDAADLPVAVVSVERAERPQIGIGGIPQGVQRGALRIEQRIDLADPTIVSGDESILLIDAARTALTAANGPIVTADGSEGPPFGPADLTVTGPGAAWQLTNDPPVGRRFRVQPDLGVIEFGEPLEATGTLVVSPHIGLWEVKTVRYRGTLLVDVVSTAADASSIARSVGAALDELPGSFKSLVPTGWASSGPVEVGDSAHQIRRLTFEFVFERVDPILPTSGGVIRTVAVDSDTSGTAEVFSIPIPA